MPLSLCAPTHVTSMFSSPPDSYIHSCCFPKTGARKAHLSHTSKSTCLCLLREQNWGASEPHAICRVPWDLCPHHLKNRATAVVSPLSWASQEFQVLLPGSILRPNETGSMSYYPQEDSTFCGIQLAPLRAASEGLKDAQCCFQSSAVFSLQRL